MAANRILLAWVLALLSFQVYSIRLLKNIHTHSGAKHVSQTPSWMSQWDAPLTNTNVTVRPLWHSGTSLKTTGFQSFVESTLKIPARLYGYDSHFSKPDVSSLKAFELLWMGENDEVFAVAHSRMGVVAALAFQFLETGRINFNYDLALTELGKSTVAIISPGGTGSEKKSIADEAKLLFTTLGVDKDHGIDYVMALNGLLLGYAKKSDREEGVMKSFKIEQVCSPEAIEKAEATIAEDAAQEFLLSNQAHDI